MIRHFAFLFAFVAATTVVWTAESEQAPTLLTTQGRLLYSEDFAQPLPPATGKPVGFASGFTGWRYNAGPGTGKSGRWLLGDGVFTGIESPEAHHPATASYGIQYSKAVIQCEVRLNDVPAEGRQYRSLFIKATDAKDYVISLSVGPGGLFLTPYDPERINPATRQRDKGPTGRVPASIKLNEWHTVVLEILGDEAVGTLDGKSVTLKNPLLASAKHSLMLGASTEASFRHLRIWEAQPNPEWTKLKAGLPAPAASK